MSEGPAKEPVFRDYSLGDSINGSPHSVCVSLPRLADVIGYEEKKEAVLRSFAAGYPRFFRNPLVARLVSIFQDRGELSGPAFLLPTQAAARDLLQFAGRSDGAVRELEGCFGVEARSAREAAEAGAYLQHTGNGLSSREAEEVLVRAGRQERFTEARAEGGAEDCDGLIRNQLHAVYGTDAVDDIRLYRSGMNAFYAGFLAASRVQAARGKDLWIQLGWLYVDTVRVMERFGGGRDRLAVFRDVLDPDALESFLRENGHRVAGIVTETPTNPLVQTPDVERLRLLADRHKALLVLDPTLASPHNLNVLRWADIHINSLTKYAASEADVMMGALALNRHSGFYHELRDALDLVPGSGPGPGDLARMAYQIRNYGPVIRKINASTREVASFLEAHDEVEEVWWAQGAGCGEHFRRVQHREGGPGGLLSFRTRRPMESVYDASRLVKSPSFGARFSMICPFMYLAHYDLVQTAAGRAELERAGVPADLLRLSVGLEPEEVLLEELDRSLQGEG